jgi:hypothetical protein
MGNPSREAWDALTEADFIHSCDCIVCKSLRDDSRHSCSGCATHHVLNKSFRARIRQLEGAVEWAIANSDRWSAKSIGDELRRRAGEGE